MRNSHVPLRCVAVLSLNHVAPMTITRERKSHYTGREISGSCDPRAGESSRPGRRELYGEYAASGEINV